MKVSAGLLMYRRNPELEVFLVHFGGPFWAKKDNGAWHIPKGIVEPGEDLLTCAKREFYEETQIVIPTLSRDLIDLGSTKYNDKEVFIWAFEQDLPKDYVFKSNKISTGLPAGRQGWPENDKGQFFPIEVAKSKILPAQKVFIERLQDSL